MTLYTIALMYSEYFQNSISEKSMERDRFMNPMEAKDFGLLDKVLEHPPVTGDD